MTDELDLGKSGNVRIVSFDGTEYTKWRMKFKALLSVKGAAEALEKDFITKMPASEDTDLSGADKDSDLMQQKRAKAKNAMAVNYLTLSFQTDELLGMIAELATDEWPNGIASKVMEALEEEYCPSNVLANANLKSKLMKMQLKKNKNPKNLSKQMAAEIAKFKIPVSKEDKIAYLVNAAGKEYAGTIAMEQKVLTIEGKKVTARALVNAMYDQWQISGG